MKASCRIFCLLLAAAAAFSLCSCNMTGIAKDLLGRSGVEIPDEVSGALDGDLSSMIPEEDLGKLPPEVRDGMSKGGIGGLLDMIKGLFGGGMFGGLTDGTLPGAGDPAAILDRFETVVRDAETDIGTELASGISADEFCERMTEIMTSVGETLVSSTNAYCQAAVAAHLAEGNETVADALAEGQDAMEDGMLRLLDVCEQHLTDLGGHYYDRYDDQKVTAWDDALTESDRGVYEVGGQ